MPLTWFSVLDNFVVWLQKVWLSRCEHEGFVFWPLVLLLFALRQIFGGGVVEGLTCFIRFAGVCMLMSCQFAFCAFAAITCPQQHHYPTSWVSALFSTCSCYIYIFFFFRAWGILLLSLTLLHSSNKPSVYFSQGVWMSKFQAPARFHEESSWEEGVVCTKGRPWGPLDNPPSKQVLARQLCSKE